MKWYKYFFIPIIFISACLQSQDNTEKNVFLPNPLFFQGNDIVFDIPYLDTIQVDGKKTDWSDRGFHARLFAGKYGVCPPENDFAVKMQLAWSDTGLFLFVEVTDDKLYESRHINYLYLGDGMELFLNPEIGKKNVAHFSVAPGQSKRYKEIRINTNDHRNSRKMRENIPLHIEAASQKTTYGYTVEAMLPFDIFEFEPEKGKELGFQIYVNDYDEYKDGESYGMQWFYITRSYLNPLAFRRIRLSDKPSSRNDFSVKAYIKDHKTAFIHVFADSSYQNKNIIIHDTSKVYFDTVLMKKDDYAVFFDSVSIDKINIENQFAVKVNNELKQIIDWRIAPLKYVDYWPYHYERSIRIYKALDQFNPPPENPVLFVGSSSFTKWNTLEDDMKDLNAINRGFGGSTVEQVMHYFNDIIIPYSPSKIVFYEGDNDIAYRMPVDDFSDSCRTFIDTVHQVFPKTEIFLVSIKPSPARQRHWQNMKKANEKLEKLSMEYNFVHYIDVASSMIDQTGNIRTDIWMHDDLHLNDKGYRIWTDIIREKLKKHINAP